MSEPLFPPNPIRYRNMAEQVAVTIRQAIVEGKLAPSSRLIEMKIAAEMRISRGPVREALFSLEREGLVVRKPNQGTYVLDLTEELLRQIASLRSVLEGFGVSLALKRLTEEDFRRLASIVDEMSVMAQADDFLSVVELDLQFHDYIMRVSGHPLLYAVWVSLEQKIRIYLSTLNRMYGDLNAVAKGHRAIIRALRRGDAERVNQIMADHMVEVLELFVAKALRTRKIADPNDSTGSRETNSVTTGIKRRGKPNSQTNNR